VAIIKGKVSCGGFYRGLLEILTKVEAIIRRLLFLTSCFFYGKLTNITNKDRNMILLYSGRFKSMTGIRIRSIEFYQGIRFLPLRTVTDKLSFPRQHFQATSLLYPKYLVKGST